MTNYDQILADLKTELIASLDYLEYSYNKIKKNNLANTQMVLEIKKLIPPGEKAIGDQKIDLKILSTEQKTESAFFKEALKNAVVLF